MTDERTCFQMCLALCSTIEACCSLNRDLWMSFQCTRSTLLQQMVVMVNICWFEKCTDAAPRSVHWHNICILYENPNIDLNTSPSSQSICSLKNVAVAINLSEYVCSMEMCWLVQRGGLKEGIVLNDIGTPWGGRQTVRGREQVICSALLHVKWDTFTLSYHFCPSSQPRFLFSAKGKLYKGSEQRASGGFCGGSSSASPASLFSSLLFHAFFLSSVSQTYIVCLCLRVSK